MFCTAYPGKRKRNKTSGQEEANQQEFPKHGIRTNFPEPMKEGGPEILYGAVSPGDGLVPNFIQVKIIIRNTFLIYLLFVVVHQLDAGTLFQHFHMLVFRRLNVQISILYYNFQIHGIFFRSVNRNLILLVFKETLAGEFL